MSSTSLTFHGTHADVYLLTDRWAADLGAEVTYELFFPEFRVVRHIDDVRSMDDSLLSVNRVSIHLDGVDLKAKSALEFVDRNPDALRIVVGREGSDGLRGSFLGAMSGDLQVMEEWRRLRNGARKSMRKGAWVLNAVNDDRVRDDGHLYTDGAKRLQDEGVPILGPSDWISYVLG